jgi:hypothetical protein
VITIVLLWVPGVGVKLELWTLITIKQVRLSKSSPGLTKRDEGINALAGNTKAKK